MNKEKTGTEIAKKAEANIARKQQRWQCAIIEDQRGDIMIGTNGKILRIRRIGEVPLEVELCDCQNTPREKMNRAQFNVDPMLTKQEEIEAFMEGQRKAQEEAQKAAAEAKLFRQKYGLKASIKKALQEGK